MKAKEVSVPPMKLLNIVSKWRIALLCSFIIFMHMGQRRIMGLLFVACLERYKAGRKQASFAFMLSVTVLFLCGPLVGFMGSKFGIKSVIVCGCLLSSISMAAIFFAEDITFVTIIYGIPLGIGTALSINLLPSLIHFHFKTKQAVASGITFVGASIGGFIFPPFCKTLLDTYGTSGTFLIMGALLLNSVPAAMLLVNPPTNDKTPKGKTNNRVKYNNENKKSFSVSSNDSKIHQCISDENVSIHGNQEHSGKKTSIATREAIDDCKSPSSNSMPITKSAKIITAKVLISEEELKYIVDNKKVGNVKNTTSEAQQDDEMSDHINISMHVPGNSDHQICFQRNNSTQNIEINPLLYIDANDINNTIGECNIPQNINISKAHASAMSKMIEEDSIEYSQSKSDTKNQNLNVRNQPSNTESDPKKTNSWKVFRVLYDPLFLLVSFATSSHMFILMTLSTIVVDFAIDKGLSVDQGVYLLMSTAIADMVGRFSFGWVTDKGHVSVTSFAAILYLAIALCFAAFAETTDFFLVMLTMAVGGVCMGTVMTVFPVMLSEYCAEEKNTMALASRFIFVVPISLATAPLIGYFRETLGSYKWMFFFIDFICIFCSIILLLIPPISRYRNRNVTQ